MPTSARATVLPVRRTTKATLDRAKGEGTYDDAIQTLLRLAPPERVARAARERRRATPEERAPRTPAKQQLIAKLAAEGWNAWLREGRARFVAPRVILWKPATPGPRLGVELLERRGLPDAPRT